MIKFPAAIFIFSLSSNNCINIRKPTDKLVFRFLLYIGAENMALSMTGFGRGTAENAKFQISIELKSVNHRFLETNIRIPRTYNWLEDKLRQQLQNSFSRGKFDLLVQVLLQKEETQKVRINFPLLEGYINGINEIKKIFPVEGELRLEHILSLDGVFLPENDDEDMEQLAILSAQALSGAIEELRQMRVTEGSTLVRDLTARLDKLNEEMQSISARAAELPGLYREKLQKRIKELLDGTPVDENRIALEVVLFTDRSSIDEEITRFLSHIQQFREALNRNEPVGRRLDFLIQEMNREVNTIGSKTNDLGISDHIVEIKTELEKIREQIQNIE